MKGKIKILSLLLAISMVSSMFVACTKEPAEDVKKDDDAKTSSVDAKKEKEPVTLTWYHWGNAPKKPDAVIKHLNEMSKKDINTEIDIKWATEDQNKVKTLLSTAGDFDIAFVASWFANYSVAAQSGQLADLTETLPKVAPKLYEYIPQQVWEGTKVGGKIYAVPTYKDTAADHFWYCNKDYVIDEVKAEEEFKATTNDLKTVTPLLEKIKAYADSKGGKYPNNCKAPINYNWNGLNGYNVGWDTLGNDDLRIGVKVDVGDNKVVPMWEDKEMLDNFKTLKAWYDKGLVNKDCLTLEKAPEFVIVDSRQCWEKSEAVLATGKPYKVQINHRYGPLLTTSSIQGSMQGISPNSKNIDRALEYLEYATTNKDYRNELGYGIKGKNWELLPEGNMKKLNDEWTPGLWAQASFFELYPEAPSPADMYETVKASQDSAKPSPLVGLVIDTTSIKNEVTACLAITEKYYKQLQTGACKDVDATAAKAMKDLKASGYQKVIDEYQKQVDAFLAKK